MDVAVRNDLIGFRGTDADTSLTSVGTHACVDGLGEATEGKAEGVGGIDGTSVIGTSAEHVGHGGDVLGTTSIDGFTVARVTNLDEELVSARNVFNLGVENLEAVGFTEVVAEHVSHVHASDGEDGALDGTAGNTRADVAGSLEPNFSAVVGEQTLATSDVLDGGRSDGHRSRGRGRTNRNHEVLNVRSRKPFGTVVFTEASTLPDVGDVGLRVEVLDAFASQLAIESGTDATNQLAVGTSLAERSDGFGNLSKLVSTSQNSGESGTIENGVSNIGLNSGSKSATIGLHDHVFHIVNRAEL